MRFHLRY